MKASVKTTIIICMLIIVGSIFAAHYFKDPLKEVDIPYESAEQPMFRTQLDNGLEITVKEMHSVPLATIQFWVHVGNRNENDTNRGVAHIFEHIWFKGTETQPVGSFHKRVENLGGELNAMTSQDWTMFYVVVPSDKFDDIFPYMVDLLKNPAFKQEEIDKELQVILEEQRMSYNNPKMYVDDKFVELLVDEHPYRVPIIGYKDTISTMKRNEIIDIHDAYYVPNNMNVVVVGDVDTPTVVDKINNALGDMKPKPLPTLDLPKQEIHVIPRYNSSTRDLGNNYIAMGYVTPESTHPDHYTLQVINTILTEMESSRLQKIRKEQNLFVSILSVSAQLNDFGAVEIVAVVDPKKRDEAVTTLIAEINKLKTKLVSDSELERAKAHIKAERAKKNEEVFEVGMEIGEAWIDGKLDELPQYYQKIDAVTKEDIKSVANKYFKAFTMYEVKAKQ